VLDFVFFFLLIFMSVSFLKKTGLDRVGRPSDFGAKFWRVDLEVDRPGVIMHSSNSPRLRPPRKAEFKNNVSVYSSDASTHAARLLSLPFSHCASR
jgi:hypothetical protein